MARRTTLAQLWWTDGRREVRRVDAAADRIHVRAADGHPHTFFATRQVSDEGYRVFVETGTASPSE
jgi:hypothetical protein